MPGGVAGEQSIWAAPYADFSVQLFTGSTCIKHCALRRDSSRPALSNR
jgi:hypothetical protein